MKDVLECFLPTTAFTSDQHRDIGWIHLPGHLDSTIQQGRVPYDSKPVLYILNIHILRHASDKGGIGTALCQYIHIIARLNAFLPGENHHGILIVTPAIILIRSEEHTSELQSLMRISYAVFCLKKKT